MKKKISKIKKINDNEYLYKEVKLKRVFSVDELFSGMNIYLVLDDVISLQQFRDKLNCETDEMYNDYIDHFIDYFIRNGNCYIPIIATITIQDKKVINIIDNLDF